MKQKNNNEFRIAMARNILIIYEIIYVVLVILVKIGSGIIPADICKYLITGLSILSLILIGFYKMSFERHKSIGNGTLLLMAVYSVLFMIF